MIGGLKLGEAYIASEQGWDGRFTLLSAQAEAIYPLDFRAREAVAMAFSYAAVHPDIVVEIVDRALASDPHSPKLLWLKVSQELRRGDFEKAETALLRLEILAPDMEQTHTARRVFDEMEKAK